MKTNIVFFLALLPFTIIGKTFLVYAQKMTERGYAHSNVIVTKNDLTSTEKMTKLVKEVSTTAMSNHVKEFCGDNGDLSINTKKLHARL